MILKWQPNRVINRFGNKYEADNQGYLKANTKEELELFMSYGFRLEETETPEEIVIEKPKKTLKSKK